MAVTVPGPDGMITGRPIPKATWEAQYQSGYWDYLHSLPEMARYFVVAGYVAYSRLSPAILDVGCGDGWLAVVLGTLEFRGYLGIDLSSEALARARALAIANARFEQADLEEWETPERFDVVILNESLYYARRPVAALQRYAQHLAPDGVLIVSMHRNAESPAIWRAVDALYVNVDSTIVQNRREVWEIRLLRR